MAPPSRPLKILIVFAGKLLAPASGGELRTLHLARSLARLGHQVDAIAFVARNHPAGFARLDESLCIRQRHSLWLDLAALADRARLIPITELSLWLTPLRPWLRALVRRERYDIVQFEFPWFVSLHDCATTAGARVVYSAHNVESAWWAPRLARYPFGYFFCKRLLAREIQAAARAAGVAACSPQDLDWLRGHFQRFSAGILACHPTMAGKDARATPPLTALVPNGYDAGRIRRPDPQQRRRLRGELAFQPAEKIAVFCGGHTYPNQEAAAAILDSIAPASPDPAVRFVIVGRVGEKLGAAARGKSLHAGAGGRSRVTVTGPVEDVLPYLQAADVALNPMLSGSGSNLKVAEACAAGLPLVTTEFGLRGFESLAPWVTVRGIDGFAGAIAESAWPNAIPVAVLDRFSWDSAARRLAEIYEEINDKGQRIKNK